MLLLSTLNRLEGSDVPGKRADLVAELTALLPMEDLTLLLPEQAGELADLLALIDLDPDALLAELDNAADRAGPPVRAITCAVAPADEAVIEATIRRVAGALSGTNRRGRALARICRDHPEDADA